MREPCAPNLTGVALGGGLVLALLFVSCGSERDGAKEIVVHPGGTVTGADRAVFFAFDDYSIPLRSNLFLTLVPVEKHPLNPLLRRGPKGSPDEAKKGPKKGTVYFSRFFSFIQRREVCWFS